MSNLLLSTTLSDLNLVEIIKSDSSQSTQAKTILLSRYHYLILKSVKPYLKIFEYDDLFQIATQGFLTALYKFDVNRGKSIGVYTRFYILNLICEYVKNSIKHEKNQKKNFNTEKNDFDYPEACIGELTTLDEEVDSSIITLAVEQFRSSLTSQEAKLVEYVFYEGKTLTESGTLMNVCKQRASQILQSVKKKGEKFFKYYN